MTALALALALPAEARDLDLGKKTVAVELTTVDSAVTVRQDPNAALVKIFATDRLPNTLCDLLVDESKGVATVRFAPKSTNQNEKCSMDFEIVLRGDAGSAKVHNLRGPITVSGTRAPVELEADEGEILLRGTLGSVEAVADRGDIQLAGAEGPLDLVVAAGSLRGTASGPLVAGVTGGVVEVEGLTQAATVTSTAGRIVLRYAAAPTGEISLRAANGDVALDLPAGTLARCLVTATGGTAVCELPSVEGAPLNVHAIADGGSVRVF